MTPLNALRDQMAREHVQGLNPDLETAEYAFYHEVKIYRSAWNEGEVK